VLKLKNISPSTKIAHVKDKPFNFHGAIFTIKVLPSETNGKYTVMDVIHLPKLGPALHMHPLGPETFYIIEGEYEFVLNEKSLIGKSGDTIFVLK
jgi:quercetin dioxygenase-like cupin family protein